MNHRASINLACIVGCATKRLSLARSFAPACDHFKTSASEQQPDSLAGTVGEYHDHILLRVSPPPQSELGFGAWWPPVVERHPLILRVFKTLALLHSKLPPEEENPKPIVKVTAFDTANPVSEQFNENSVDLMAFPAGIRYPKLPADMLETVVQHVLRPGKPETPLPPSIAALQESLLRKVCIFVCCHGARDARCGSLGPPLASHLLHLVRERGLNDQVYVFKTSHVGGHQYAGNVLVYGAAHPTDGDWFGLLDTHQAEEFLDALLNANLDADGGAEVPKLRKWWRGRMGLSKAAQRELWFTGGAVREAENYESDSDEEEE